MSQYFIKTHTYILTHQVLTLITLTLTYFDSKLIIFKDFNLKISNGLAKRKAMHN